MSKKEIAIRNVIKCYIRAAKFYRNCIRENWQPERHSDFELYIQNNKDLITKNWNNRYL
jgi:hypothetical protein